MQTRFALLCRTAALAGLLALAACNRGDDNIAALDNELLANGADPALTSALEDQILVDPNLVQQAHPNTVRPPETPAQAQYPAGPASRATAGAQSASAAQGDPGSTVCGAPFDYGPEWADRLPAEFPLYPGGRVTEAAGANTRACRTRIVTFQTRDPFQRVIEHYRNLAGRAGFSAEHQRRGADHLLGGVNQRTDGAFVVIATPLPAGTDVALIVNNGR